MSKAFLIPVTGPCREVVIDDGDDGDSLGQLQALVGGYIEPIGVPDFIPGAEYGTAYINEEGKIFGLEPNMRATDFMVPGIGLSPRDYIVGNMVLLGYNPHTGENADVPEGMVKRAKLIEEEAGQ
jgi:hypothetical protein